MMKTKQSASPQHTGQCESILRRASRCALLTAFLGLAIPAFAQLTTADIVGTVTDATGAVIPNAQITVVNLDTHQQRNITSNASGEYQVTTLPVGRYSVTVKVLGFKTASESNLAIEAGDRARADIHMETGGGNETVLVEAQTPCYRRTTRP